MEYFFFLLVPSCSAMENFFFLLVPKIAFDLGF
jgi:hypothetical protein